MDKTLTNQISSKPLNGNVGYNNSWIKVENKVNRDLFAQASFITNFADMPPIVLSSADVQIGGVEIKDWDSDLRADVTASDGLNALRVLTQDFKSSIQNITIGDPDENYVSVVPHLSSLQVTLTNLNDSSNVDAFGRLRVSQPHTLFDFKSLYDKGRYFWNSAARDGEDIFNANDSTRTLSVTANGGYYVKETYRRFAYQPGKSHLALFTGILQSEIDIIKRIGLFQSLSGNDYTDSTTGFYFQAYKTTGTPDNQSYAWVINNSTNLVPSQSAVQVNWNIDRMDGTGPSKINLDFSKAQIFVIDFEWLGVGRVRFGFNVDGITYYCHQVLNANKINGTYLTIPNNPLRAEIRSTGASSGSMKMICASIMSEGGSDPTFITRSVSTSAIANAGTNNRRGILGIRLAPDRTNSVNEIIDISSVCNVGNVSSTGPYKIELVFRPNRVANVSWVAVNADSSIQYANPTNGIELTGGTTVITELAASNSGISLTKPQYEKVLKLGRDLQGVPEECWLVVTPLVSINGVHAAITFAEAD
jgi:hypothetical protein